MGNEEQTRSEVIQQKVENMRKLNLLDDTFASVVLEDIGACQYVVRKILDKDDIRIISAKGKYKLSGSSENNAIVEAIGLDSTGYRAIIEILRIDADNFARKTRYYNSMIDNIAVDNGAGCYDLPDVYIIYISETDIWHTGKTVYPLKKTLAGTDITYDDGNHVVFVNATVDDGSEAAQMMQYFKEADPQDMSQGELSERVRYLKCEKEGYEELRKVAERISAQGIGQDE